MEKLTCASCGTDMDPKAGPGRPSVYCGEPCRRIAEFRIRALVRRIDRAEVELREVKVGTGFYDDEDRRVRVRTLRRWIKQDTATLHALLGAKESNQAEIGTDIQSGISK